MKKLQVGLPAREGFGCVLAGLLGAAAFPPLGAWPLILTSIALFLYQIREQRADQARPLGLVYGFTFALGTMYWFFGMFGVLTIPLMALMAGYFGLLATGIGWTRGLRPLTRAALAALFAVAIEWFRGDAWYLRFPWYTPPHALAAMPAWVAAARWLGVYGISYVIWWVAAAGAFARPHYWLAFLALPVCVFLLPGFEPPDRRALLVQVEEPMPVEPLLRDIPNSSVELAVLPEYAFPFSFQSALTSKHGPATLARRLNCPVIFGTVDGEYGEPGFQNVAAVLDAQGELLGTFPKQRPVPLMVDGKPGQRCPVFAVEDGILGVALCYDFDAPAVAAELVRQGATVLIAPIGDLMPWSRVQHVHHELILRLRAIENDRWILRTASSGRSEAIDPHGVPSTEGLAIGTTGYVEVAYAFRSGVPLGGQAQLFGPLAAGLSVVVLGWLTYDRHRLRQAEQTTSKGNVAPQ